MTTSNPVLPKILSYRFRFRTDAAQREFVVPTYITAATVSGFYLEQEPGARSAFSCGHSVMADMHLDGTSIGLRFAGLAGRWEHTGDSALCRAVLDVTSSVFEQPVTRRDGDAVGGDWYYLRRPADRSIVTYIEEYVRALAEVWPVTRGWVSYIRTYEAVPRRGLLSKTWNSG